MVIAMLQQPAILYVEDDLQSRMVMEILLTEDLGLTHVTLFEDSRDFIKRLEALEPAPDVILLDIHMKPHSGFEMLDMLRSHPDYRHKSIIALTASVMNEEVSMLQKAGFSGVIAKPIQQEIFGDLLERIVNGER